MIGAVVVSVELYMIYRQLRRANEMTADRDAWDIPDVIVAQMADRIARDAQRPELAGPIAEILSGGRKVWKRGAGTV